MTNICRLISIVDFEIQGQTYFQMTFIISGSIHATDLIFSIDFNIIEVQELRKSKTDNVAIITDLENDTNLKTKWFDLENQGQPSRLGD